MKFTQLASASALALVLSAPPSIAQTYQDSAGTAVPGVVQIAPGVGPLFTSANPGQVLCSNCSGGGGGGTLTFPDVVAGSVNSGGIPFFSSSTLISSTAVLVANSLMVGGGAGSRSTHRNDQCSGPYSSCKRPNGYGQHCPLDVAHARDAGL
jgi:hypothetical protein